MPPRLPGMGGFRAKDADRDRYVDVIESAYVDGQLGDQDRELRISRALTAETLDGVVLRFQAHELRGGSAWTYLGVETHDRVSAAAAGSGCRSRGLTLASS